MTASGSRRWPVRALGELLRSLHAASVPLLPVLAAIGFLVHLAIRWRHARLEWLPLWAPWLVPLLLQPLLGGRWETAAALGAHVAFGAALSASCRLTEASILVGGTVAVLMLAGLVGVDRWHSARSWYALAASAVQPIGVEVGGGIDRVHGGGVDRAARTWDLEGPVAALEGSIALRWAPLERFDAGAGGEVPPTHTGVAAGDDPDDTSPAAASGLGSAAAAATGLELHALLPASDRTHRLVQPLHATHQWTEQTFRFEHGALAIAPFVQLRLAVPDGRAVEVRSTRLSAQGTAAVAVRPLPTRPRARLWFEHFNLLGHSAAIWVAVVLTVAALRQSWAAYLLVLVGGLAITVASGSRAATLAVVLAVAMHGLARWWARWRHSPTATRPAIGCWFLGAAAAFAAVALALTFALRPVDGFGPSRLSVWAVAVGAIVDQPLIGASLPFGSAFAQARPGVGAEAVSHAHNLWLDAGYRYGIPGLLAMAWFVGGMVRLAWRRAGWHGMAIAVPFLALQAFDATMWYPGVLVALLIGANLRAEVP